MSGKKTCVVIVGAGYVGFSSAVLLSPRCEVAVVDIDPKKVERINLGFSPIQDDGIGDYMKSRSLNARAASDAEEVYSRADYIILALPTNYDEKTGKLDCSLVSEEIDRINGINQQAVVIIKSTVQIGFTKAVQEKYPNQTIVFMPEFLRESKALYDSLHPSRIVVGTCCSEKTKAVEEFIDLHLSCIEKKDVDVLYVNSTEAEAIKLFSNTYLAMRVSFFNELDTYADEMGLDAKNIIDGVCMDPRIGQYYNNPSFGYGGYCLPKDTKQLLMNYEGVPQRLISGIITSNETRKRYIADKVCREALEKSEDPTIGIYRVTMKSNSDDFREAAIWDILEIIRNRGQRVIIYEPLVEKDSLDGVEVLEDLEDFKRKSDLIFANRFSSADLSDVKDKVFTRDIFMRD